MLLVEMRRLVLDEQATDDATERFRSVVARTGEFLSPMIGSLQNQQIAYLDAPDSIFSYDRKKNIVGVSHGPGIRECEIFATGDFVIVIALQDEEDTRNRLVSRFSLDSDVGVDFDGTDQQKHPQAVYAYAIGGSPFKAALDRVSRVVEEVFGAPLTLVTYPSPRIEGFFPDARVGQLRFEEHHLPIAHVLEDQTNRRLALTIGKSGRHGMLLSHAARELPGEALSIDSIRDDFVRVGLVEAEIVDAPQERRLAITPAGRYMLDQSRWMSLLVREYLLELGVREADILFECKIGDSEIDCITNVCGELIMFELKDKVFSLGDAYRFNSKMNIVKPRYPLILTTKYVGGDAKQFFIHTKAARFNLWDRLHLPVVDVAPDGYEGSYTPGYESKNRVIYVEGMDKLYPVLRNLIDSIYHTEALTILRSAVPFALPDPSAILKLVESRLSR